MDVVPLVEVTRGGQVESIHFGAIAVVNKRGELLYHAGNPDFLTFTRSTLKPFQALPFLRDGGPAHFAYGSRELALMCASHSGEAMHIDIVQSMLHRAGCDERELRCGCHVPIHFSTAGKQPSAGETFNQLHNNCSGKHAGFLAYCVQHGQPLGTYLDPAHRLQQAIRQSVAHMTGTLESALVAGVDGCSAPNYAVPLSRLAYAYARLAGSDPDPLYGDLPGQLFDAMTTYPALVSGTGRIDLAFMQTAPGDWVAKGGAEAVQAIGIRSAGLGIALKGVDGNARGLYPAAISVLQQIGLLPAPEATPLAGWMRPQLHNAMGLHTGEVRAVVNLVKT
ncbi:MAG TPA: asparaginase [Noviherbaspirillum sp.]|nr:asparaginase [Noviherbaspirillum sp.]